ncbi:MAG: argininosuccinate synthase [Actinobacteria bacterium]|nr:argininosuccinate synthase [Actinomycetota bacterium]
MGGKAILAYSGGLDTSVSIKWIKQNYGMDVIAVLIDCGQPDDLNEAYERAMYNGALKALIVDAKEEFVNDFIAVAVKANLKYEKNYVLATALARPLIVKRLVEAAEKENADAVAHGCTAKGNDQVRFDVGIRSLNPNLKIIAPLREWTLTREEEIEFAKKNNIKINVTRKSPYSVDENLWGRSIECGILEDPWAEPPEDVYEWSKITKKPDQSEYIELGFERGMPVSLNGRREDPTVIIASSNKIAGAYGIGRSDMVENRLVGIKSREIYEAPAAALILESHRQLESMILDRELLHYKYLLEEKMAEMVYYGLWFTPLMDCLKSFTEKSQEYISGTIKIKLGYKNFAICGRKSDYSLYDLKLATYDKGDLFDPKHSESFIKIWGYPYEILGLKGRIKTGRK